MGTSSEHNNARVLNITQYDVRDFRTLSPPQSFIITNRYSYNQSPHFTWIEHPQADYHRVYRCLTTSGTYPPSCFMLVGGGPADWTVSTLSKYNPNIHPDGDITPTPAFY